MSGAVGGTDLRPRVEEATAEKLRQAVDEQTKVPVDALSFDQQLQLALDRLEELEEAPGAHI